MIRLGREFRLVPVVVLATASLFALKSIAILMDGGFTLGRPHPAHAEELFRDGAAPQPGDLASGTADAEPSGASRNAPTWAQQMLGYPDYTGEIGGAKATAGGPPAVADKAAQTQPVSGDVVKADPAASADRGRTRGTPGERAVLESLNQRRQELEARARDLDMRESLLGAAERRIESRLSELKELEARINADMHKRDEAEAAQFKGLVTMYENMKPKDAARIFDRLDLKILIDVVGQMNPRKMSDILGQMSSEAAERLTTEIARRSGAAPPDAPPPASDLPKIEGRPSGT